MLLVGVICLNTLSHSLVRVMTFSDFPIICREHVDIVDPNTLGVSSSDTKLFVPTGVTQMTQILNHQLIFAHPHHKVSLLNPGLLPCYKAVNRVSHQIMITY